MPAEGGGCRQKYVQREAFNGTEAVGRVDKFPEYRDRFVSAPHGGHS